MYPQKRVSGIYGFVYTAFGGETGNDAVHRFMCLQTDFMQVFVLLSGGQKRNVGDFLMRFQIAKVQIAIFADRIMRLRRQGEIGIKIVFSS